MTIQEREMRDIHDVTTADAVLLVAQARLDIENLHDLPEMRPVLREVQKDSCCRQGDALSH